jgi:Flp pilus assembly protein TadG
VIRALAQARRGSVARTDNHGQRGQSLVEFALILPVFLMLLLGLVEFGFVFAHYQGLEYATREGARTASALANGQNGQNGAPVGTACTTIDDQVIAAVQRVITGTGSLLVLANVSQIRIYKYDDATSAPATPATSNVDVWTPASSGTSVVDGTALKFKRTSGTWDACNRLNGLAPDSVGVDVTYSYTFATGLGSLLRWAGVTSLPMTDSTVMVLNP